MKTIFLWWRAEDELSYSLKKEAALLPSGTTAEQLAYNVTFYVGLATYYVLFLDYYYDIIHIHMT